MPRRNKYNQSFERDFKWYLRVRHDFNFDGTAEYLNKKGEKIIQYDKKGVDGKRAFFEYDSNGVIKPTKHPNLLHSLLKTKGSVNLHIKMYAEDRAHFRFPYVEFRALCISLGAPDWFREAVENQKYKYYDEITPSVNTGTPA